MNYSKFNLYDLMKFLTFAPSFAERQKISSNG